MSKAQELEAKLQASLLSNKVQEEVVALLRTQDALLRQALEALDIAFGYDGDVFGKYHNDVTDTFLAIKGHLK